jgi:hypothetical protein
MGLNVVANLYNETGNICENIWATAAGKHINKYNIKQMNQCIKEDIHCIQIKFKT